MGTKNYATVALVIVGVAGALAYAGCSSDETEATPGADAGSTDSSLDTNSGPTPTLTITSPAENATIVITDDPDVPVAYTVTNFTVKKPGTCAAGEAHCGHVEIKVDGDACNNKEPGEEGPFNHSNEENPIPGGLDYCEGGLAAINGPHTFVLRLVNDNNTPVAGAASATLHITAKFELDAGTDAAKDAPADAPDGG
jgi:hypothetical protein